MSQSISNGEILNYTTSGAVVNGQLMVLNRLAGVAMNSATGSGQNIALALKGVFTLNAVATGVKTRGLRAMYRTTGSQLKITCVSGVATGAKMSVGYVWETATAASTTVKVRLHGGVIAPLT